MLAFRDYDLAMSLWCVGAVGVLSAYLASWFPKYTRNFGPLGFVGIKPVSQWGGAENWSD